MIWIGHSTSGTEITYDKSLDNYPTAKRLIFVFRYGSTNNTLNIEIPYHIWDMNTNYGAFSRYSDNMYVQLSIIPRHDLSNTGCTLCWSSDDAYQYVLTHVMIEY